MKIFFSVGEPSGDLHGANLIKALRARHDNLELVGYGGPKMQAAGCELHEDLTQLAIMWILRVLLNLHKFIGLMWRADRYFRDEKPDAVILIDYPGFNWWIARKAKARGIPVFYYGTPQLWAWLPGRVKKMKKFVDHVLCKLPFEEQWYKDRDCNATFVGHPFYDELQNQTLDQAFMETMQNQPGPLVTILPGSRTQEVAKNLDAFLKTAKLIKQQQPETRFVVAAFKEKQLEAIQSKIDASGLEVEAFVGRTPELIKLAHSCLACSGSVSLELLFHEKPTVIHYKISKFDHFVQSYLRKVKYITLVNILWSKQAFYDGEYFTYDPDNAEHEQVPFPEYLTCEDRTADMARWITTWLQDNDAYQQRVSTLQTLKQKVAGSGASAKGAEYILQHMVDENPASETMSKAA
ncbi:MAG: lipid-A-disaccharide synthase [Blastopirellula sp.]|nr:MAG: lipid-A-disaccharide synthase [Blastopirellula sp.]